jgi:hypothetical protein
MLAKGEQVSRKLDMPAPNPSVDASWLPDHLTGSTLMTVKEDWYCRRLDQQLFNNYRKKISMF